MDRFVARRGRRVRENEAPYELFHICSSLCRLNVELVEDERGQFVQSSSVAQQVYKNCARTIGYMNLVTLKLNQHGVVPEGRPRHLFGTQAKARRGRKAYDDASS